MQVKKITLLMFFISIIIFPIMLTTQTVEATQDISNTSLKVSFDGGTGVNISINNTDTSGDPILGMLTKYKEVLVIFSSIASITFGFFFIINVMKLANSGSNPRARELAISGLLICLICSALLGGFAVILAFFQEFLKI